MIAMFAGFFFGAILAAVSGKDVLVLIIVVMVISIEIGFRHDFLFLYFHGFKKI